MKEQLISLETAKLAKEKGFDIKVMGYYSHPTEYEPELTEFNIDDDELEIQNYNNYDDFPWIFYSAPNQSLLQKWLREKHLINVESNYLPNINTYRCLYIPKFLKENRIQYVSKIDYNTYEEALEKGLIEALKLIKI